MEETKTPLPAWARILIAMFFAGLLLSFILLGMVCYQFGSADAKQMAHDFVGIDELPPGFHYERALWLPAGGGMVWINYDKDNTNFHLMKLANRRENKDIVKLLQNDPTRPEGPLEIKEQMVEKIDGKDFTCLLGTVPNITGAGRHEQLRGGAVVGDGHFIVKITGETPKGSYNMDATKQLFSSMKRL